MTTSPEIGQRIDAGGIPTNVHVLGERSGERVGERADERAAERAGGPPVVLLHGSGPGVTAFANWRLTMPHLARRSRVVAPDLLGFGFTERPADNRYDKARWLDHVEKTLDALDLGQVDLVGNSFGGALALAFALSRPERVRRLVLMGSVGVSFPLTAGLDAVWGYTPSFENMRKLLDVFAYDRALVNDELAQLRYQASVQPGFQESFAAMFPAPRQRWVDAMASDEAAIRKLPHKTLVIHGRDDQVIPLSASLRLAELLPDAELHVFNRCGHWTQIEHAARFNELVSSFFAAE